MTIDPVFAAFYRGKDAIPGDPNPYYPEGSAEWHAWCHGFESEYGERTPLSDNEVRARFADLNRR